MNRRGSGFVSGATGLPSTVTTSPSSTGVVASAIDAIHVHAALGHHALGLAPAADAGLLEIDVEAHQPPVTGGKKATSRAPANGRIERHMRLVHRGAQRAPLGKGRGNAVVRRAQEVDQVTDRRDRGRNLDLFHAAAGDLADAGEIEDLHSIHDVPDAGAEIIIAGVEREARRDPQHGDADAGDVQGTTACRPPAPRSGSRWRRAAPWSSTWRSA